MLYYNGIGVFEGIDVNKASASKNVFKKGFSFNQISAMGVMMY